MRAPAPVAIPAQTESTCGRARIAPGRSLRVIPSRRGGRRANDPLALDADQGRNTNVRSNLHRYVESAGRKPSERFDGYNSCPLIVREGSAMLIEFD